MLNKKGGVPIDELRGFLTFVFIFVVLLLFFLGCSVINTKKEYQKAEFSKSEIDVIGDLNFFLQIPVGQKKVSDVIISSYLQNNYADLEKIATEHFSALGYSWRLAIIANGIYKTYDSYALDKAEDVIVAQSEVRIPVLERNAELTVLLQKRKKSN